MCLVLSVTRQGYYKWRRNNARPYKHADLLAKIKAIIAENEFNKLYGIKRMHETLVDRGINCTYWEVRRVMHDNGLIHKKKHNPQSLTKADKDAQKSDNLLNRDFTSERPCEKLVSDITQYPTADGKLYVSGIYDCFDNACLAVTMDDNMRKELVIATLTQAAGRYDLRDAIFHTDRGSQYTSADFRNEIAKHDLRQSMNSEGGRCHDNAKCESMWGRTKSEILALYDTSKMPMEDVKKLIFRYMMGYWNTERTCSVIGGTTPAQKCTAYYEKLAA